jgi:hypothetical protein
MTSFSQNKSKTDTTITKFYAARLLYGCLESSEVSNYNFKKDSILFSFFKQIESDRNFKYKDISSLLKLVNIAEGDSDITCFLPFLKMVDPEANKIYQENCYVSPKQLPFLNYCIEPPIQFSVLFYLQYIVIDTLKLKQGAHVSDIILRNKKKAKDAALTQADYHKLYDIYRNWILNSKTNKSFTKNPLKHSGYEWVLKYKDYVRK